MDLSPNGIVLVDLRGNVVFCNDAFFEFTGFTREEVLGKKFSAMPQLRKKDIPQYIKIFGSLLKGKKPKPLHVSWVHKDGTQRTSEAHIGFIRKNGFTGWW